MTSPHHSSANGARTDGRRSPLPRPPSSRLPLADLRSGAMVFLIALPLCLGIAVASGFPPVAGILTAIVGGVVVSCLGSARLTIKGPAAGLIVIALGAVTELGAGDPVAGYRRALAVGVVAAVIQIAFSLVRAASIGVAIPPSVVHGMLAAIGVIIIAKQVHVAVGAKPEGSETLELIAEIPHSLAHADGTVTLVAAVSLVILFGMPLLRGLRAVPAPIVVLVVAVPLGLFLDLGAAARVALPGSLLDAVTFPDFSMVFEPASLKYIVMYALIGTVESTLTVLAVDTMDPEKRPSDLNRDLLALGSGNLASSLIGGLPMISEIVRSKANIDAGARSAASNFFHGALLLLSVALVPGLLQKIPLAALAAMLIFTGTRLASPREFLHATRLGRDQLAVFLTTLLVTLATDLLIGVAAGLALEILMHLARGVPPLVLARPRVTVRRDAGRLLISMGPAAVFSGVLPLRSATSRLAGSGRPATDRTSAGGTTPDRSDTGATGTVPTGTGATGTVPTGTGATGTVPTGTGATGTIPTEIGANGTAETGPVPTETDAIRTAVIGTGVTGTGATRRGAIGRGGTATDGTATDGTGTATPVSGAGAEARATAAADAGGVAEVVIDLREARLVDHTFLARLHTMAQEWGGTRLTVLGLEDMTPVSDHEHATRRRIR